MKHSERVAKAVIELVLPGAVMTPNADQSHGEHDFDMQCPDGSFGIVEVTSATDERVRATRAAIGSAKKGGRFIERVLGDQGWLLHPRGDANINRLRAEADQYLLAIEAAQLDSFHCATEAAEHESVARIWRELRIECGRTHAWRTPRTIGLAIPGQGGAVSAQVVVDAVSTEARKADNLRKLRRPGASESHLFVYVDPAAFLAWVGLVDEHPPADLLVLPDGPTHVWVATETRTMGEHAVWRMGRGQPWRNLGPLTLPL